MVHEMIFHTEKENLELFKLQLLKTASLWWITSERFWFCAKRKLPGICFTKIVIMLEYGSCYTGRYSLMVLKLCLVIQQYPEG